MKIPIQPNKRLQKDGRCLARHPARANPSNHNFHKGLVVSYIGKNQTKVGPCATSLQSKKWVLPIERAHLSGRCQVGSDSLYTTHTQPSSSKLIG
ncbi:hypothetical protein AMTR_s00033p00137920 [Amborella trichopoda]|uniref:Uncharacterized protein n=1 Tax=Amborella trichopoda TaxID=13333 RepID=U5D1J6_AMBTC|nr:hypothetical protein AMTR_s00033p00137920 [Amborella trichopoda]